MGCFECTSKPMRAAELTSRWSKREESARLGQAERGLLYLLRSNVTDWSGEELWRAYMQLTEAEAAFRIHKS